MCLIWSKLQAGICSLGSYLRKGFEEGFEKTRDFYHSHWLVRVVAISPLAAMFFLFILIVAYRFVAPPFSSLMAGHALAGVKIQHRWIALEKISRHLPIAVMMSEDAGFCSHSGVDWEAVEKAWEAAAVGELPRGASTIPMQTAKNLFLWPAQNYLRKAIEIPLAYVMSFVWPKRRMIEIYLNIAEWGPGIFGAEAAARHHFKKSAAALNRREAALLAAALPNPYVRRAGRPGPKTRAVARVISKRMRKAGPWIKCLASN